MGTWLEERTVTVEDVLGYFDARSQVPSASLGGTVATQSPAEKQERREIRMLQGAAVYRCVSLLLRVDRLPSMWNATAIGSIARRYGLGDGEVVVRVLSLFGPWRNSWPTKGYHDVHGWHTGLRDGQAVGIDDFRQAQDSDEYVASQTLVQEANAVVGRWVNAWKAESK